MGRRFTLYPARGSADWYTGQEGVLYTRHTCIGRRFTLCPARRSADWYTGQEGFLYTVHICIGRRFTVYPARGSGDWYTGLDRRFPEQDFRWIVQCTMCIQTDRYRQGLHETLARNSRRSIKHLKREGSRKFGNTVCNNSKYLFLFKFSFCNV